MTLIWALLFFWAISFQQSLASYHNLTLFFFLLIWKDYYLLELKYYLSY